MKVNGVRVKADCTLKPSDEVAYYMTPAEEGKTAFTVLYEDENVTVADKESGVNSEAVFSALSEKRETYFIHRLDRNTEGVMIFGHTMSANEALLSAFRERRVQKIYHALVFGVPQKQHALERAFLEKDARAARVNVNTKGRGVPIETEYELLAQRGETSLLKVTLHTGKTHQIRAHLAFLGLPVVGDEKYGDSARNKAFGAARQRLLAKQLTVDCPEIGLCGATFTSPKNL